MKLDSIKQLLILWNSSFHMHIVWCSGHIPNFLYWNLFDKPQPRYSFNLIHLMPCILLIFMKLPISCQAAKNKIIKTMISKSQVNITKMHLIPKNVLHLFNNNWKLFVWFLKLFFVLDKWDSNLDSDTLFFSFEWNLSELWELLVKYKRALSHKTRGSFELYLLLHKPKCTFYSWKFYFLFLLQISLHDYSVANAGLLPWGAGGAPPEAVPLETFAPPLENWSENNRKISITKEICITVDFNPWKNPWRKPEW